MGEGLPDRVSKSTATRYLSSLAQLEPFLAGKSLADIQGELIVEIESTHVIRELPVAIVASPQGMRKSHHRRRRQRSGSGARASSRLSSAADAAPGLIVMWTGTRCATFVGDGTAIFPALAENDCVAGHVGLEPPNPCASYLIGITGQLRLRTAQAVRRRPFACELRDTDFAGIAAIAAMRWRRHSWRDVNPQACRHNARPVFGSRSGKGVRAADCSSRKGRGTAAPFLAEGPGWSAQAAGRS